ncbi:MAG: Chloroplast import component protein (Tic20) [Candidatus Omnitrophica bacterium ADurb.Bin277]|nr:MAG: Chloroplast import component protein (Tic20) [Candidatus Omnitrophica bacterium ADurb.Bin277]
MTTNEPGMQDKDPEVQDAKFFAAIGYIGFLCFVPLSLKKGNKFAEFHGKQGLVLFILELAAAILSVVPILGDLISHLALVVFGILSLIGIVKVLMGEKWEIPVIHEIANRISL